MDQLKAARAPRRRRNADAPTTPDAIEIAMEAEASGRIPIGGAAEVLRRHAHLLSWQMASERASYALKLLTGVVGLVVALTLAGLIWTSSRYQGLVVQAFSAPPDLVARGLTGEVLAGDLMDRLVAMQEQTDSVRAPSSYGIDWSDGTEVEIPQTGVSIGELRRYLRSWLGKETRISGVVYRRRDGQLAVTARTAGTAGATFVGPEEELDALMRQAAETVYARTQPYRYTVYLLGHGRTAEAEPVWKTAETYGEPESLWLVRGWGLELARRGDLRGALQKYHWVKVRAPNMGALYQTIADAEASLGHDEASHRARMTAARLIPKSRDIDSKKRVDYGASEILRAALQSHDLRQVQGLEAAPNEPIDVATLELMRKDLGAATWRIGSLPSTPRYHADRALGYARLALATEDYEQALLRLTAARQAALADEYPGYYELDISNAIIAASIGLGRYTEARTLANSLPADCYRCEVSRAEVAEAMGEVGAADRAFARADAMAPSLADASFAWARAQFKRGGVDGAIQKAVQAHRRAPNWPDPLKLWGDALLNRGDAQGAIRKYRAAAELAPNWGGLHLSWGQALEQRGRREEALGKYRQARSLGLTRSERVEVERRLGRPAAA